MQRISDLIDRLEEVIESGKYYTENYLDAKMQEHTIWANRCKEMAVDSIKAAGYIHDKLMDDVKELRRTYNMPIDMVEVWEQEHKNYIEKIAWLKQLLLL